MSEPIRVELQNRILRITLDRPDKMNALDGRMSDLLADALEQADQNPEVRVIYIGANGDNFCAGLEIPMFVGAIQDQSGTQAQQVAQHAERILLQLSRTRKPMVVAIKGAAVGIGANMMLHCDLAYADTSTRFMLPFINLGIAPEGGSSKILPRMIGHVKAAELLMLGDFFSADKAAELGLINAVCEPEALESTAWQAAQKLAAKPPQALRDMKAYLRSNPTLPLEEVICSEVQAIRRRFHHPEAQEAIQAFVDKREADFSGFS